MEQEIRTSVRNIGKVAGITLAVYAGIRWLLPLVLPFFIALMLAKCFNPLVEKWSRKMRMKRGILASILIFIFLLLAGTGIVIFLKALLGQVKNVFEHVDIIQSQADLLWKDCCEQIEDFTGIHAATIYEAAQQYIPRLMKRFETDGIPSLVNGTVTYAKGSLILVGIGFITVISAILLLKDYPTIRKTLEHHPVGKIGLKVCRNTYSAGGAYLKAQLIIMLIVTVICVAGLFFSGNEYALLAGSGIGLCDALPFLGTGTIFVPWAVIEMIQGNYMLAAIYAAIYAVSTLVREILEPKLVGDKLGMHPLIVIISIYVGIHLYGLWGFALGPFSYILIREIYLCGFRRKSGLTDTGF